MIGHAGNSGGTSVSDYLADWVREQGIRQVFTLPGGMIAPILDAFHRRGAVELVTMHHEQGVAFAADGVGRFTGAPSVALATAGPGATNMLTAIGSAYLDSIPALFLTGQVQSYLLKGQRPLRQYGFQECDVVAMAAPVTKGAWRAASARDVPGLLDLALRTAVSGRPGPVLVELPSDVQTAAVPADAVPRRITVAPPDFEDRAVVDELLAAVAAARQPVALLGGGIHLAGAAERCRELLRVLRLPAAASVTALDVLPADDPLRLGMIGMYGNRWVNMAMAEADLVLALGTKLDFGTIGADTAPWVKGRPVYQVDCDPGEVRRIRGVRGIIADLGRFLDVALSQAGNHEIADRTPWTERLAATAAEWPDTGELAGCPGINPNTLVRQLSAASTAARAFVIDAGQHLWWACQSFQPAPGQRFLPALGLGPCGWALPAAIGVAFAARGPVVLFAGDGSFQFNIQELQTVVRSRLPVKIVIVDNAGHGSVRQLQEAIFDGRYPTTVWGYDAPDFVRVAEAYGIAGRAVSDPQEMPDALRWLWRDQVTPALLHVRIDQSLNVYPNVPFGAPITAMEARPRDPEGE